MHGLQFEPEQGTHIDAHQSQEQCAFLGAEEYGVSVESMTRPDVILGQISLYWCQSNPIAGLEEPRQVVQAYTLGVACEQSPNRQMLVLRSSAHGLTATFGVLTLYHKTHRTAIWWMGACCNGV